MGCLGCRKTRKLADEEEILVKYLAKSTVLLIAAFMLSASVGCSDAPDSPGEDYRDTQIPDAGQREDGVGEDAGSDDANSEDGLSAPDSVDSPDAAGPDALDPPPEDEPLAAGSKFIWPLAGWVNSTDQNPEGEEDPNASAGIAAPHWSDVGAARGGRVEIATHNPRAGYYVRLDHGDGYTTTYEHLAEKPVVAKGDTVVTGQVLGYSGATGDTEASGPSLNFAIRKDGARLSVSNIELGDWVKRGEAIEGDFPELSDLQDRGNTEFEVKIAQPAPLLSAPQWRADILGDVDQDEVFSVIGSDSGYYQIEKDGLRGFIPHSASRPLKSEIYPVKFKRNGNIRDLPGMEGTLVGVISREELVAVFEHSDDDIWRRIIYRPEGEYPAYYWVNRSNVDPTDEFSARVQSAGINVRSGPDSGLNSLGKLDFYEPVHVLETHQGWYRIDYGGKNGWIGGWHTQGQR